MPKTAHDFWKTRRGFTAKAVVAGLLSYIAASLAINSGSLLQYAAAIVLLVFAVHSLVRIVHQPTRDQV